jgi:pilus assembly protein Flp/PilA
MEITPMNDITRLIEDESGATAIEYGLIAALVSVAIIAALTLLGENLSTLFDGIADTIGTAS